MAMTDESRKTAGQLAHEYLAQDDPTGWFEPLYAGARGDADGVPWAHLRPNPALVEWLQREKPDGTGQAALVVGCGLGDDAEELAQYGYDVTAFDISSAAIDWCCQRWPQSPVGYQVADLFEPPSGWPGKFDFVLEIITVQALPLALRSQAIDHVARFVAPGGRLLVMGGLLAEGADRPGPPWPMTRMEVRGWQQAGLYEVQFERLDGPAPFFRALFQAS